MREIEQEEYKDGLEALSEVRVPIVQDGEGFRLDAQDFDPSRVRDFEEFRDVGFARREDYSDLENLGRILLEDQDKIRDFASSDSNGSLMICEDGAVEILKEGGELILVVRGSRLGGIRDGELSQPDLLRGRYSKILAQARGVQLGQLLADRLDINEVLDNLLLAPMDFLNHEIGKNVLVGTSQVIIGAKDLLRDFHLVDGVIPDNAMSTSGQVDFYDGLSEALHDFIDRSDVLDKVENKFRRAFKPRLLEYMADEATKDGVYTICELDGEDTLVSVGIQSSKSDGKTWNLKAWGDVKIQKIKVSVLKNIEGKIVLYVDVSVRAIGEVIDRTKAASTEADQMPAHYPFEGVCSQYGHMRQSGSKHRLQRNQLKIEPGWEPELPDLERGRYIPTDRGLMYRMKDLIRARAEAAYYQLDCRMGEEIDVQVISEKLGITDPHEIVALRKIIGELIKESRNFW